MGEPKSSNQSRRQFLSSTALALLVGSAGHAAAETIAGRPPWRAFGATLPPTLEPGAWYFFSRDEARTVGAIVERLIPADTLSPSGKDAGCVEFIDRQLAGSYGSFERLYMKGPFMDGTAEQGDQSPLNPRNRYRLGLAALDAHCRTTHQNIFADLPGEQRDQILTGLEKGQIVLTGIEATLFFQIVLQNTMEGFFADPIYGGNKDMVSWKMLGFPGARYDYRDYIDRHNQKLDLPPLGIAGRIEWRVRG
jgi:gluconate 2-dehydrogenase gamma chain